MYRYGKVIFKQGGEKGANLQKTLVSRLNAQGVITVSKDLIEKWYEQDRVELAGCVHSYALHNREETDIFKTIMESEEMQDESIRWTITRFEHDRKFRKWCEEIEEKNSKKQAEKEYWETVEPKDKKEKKD